MPAGTQTAAALLIIKEKSWPICSGSVWGVGVLHSNANLTKPPLKNRFCTKPSLEFEIGSAAPLQGRLLFCLCKTNYNHNHIIRCIILLFRYKELAMPAYVHFNIKFYCFGSSNLAIDCRYISYFGTLYHSVVS